MAPHHWSLAGLDDLRLRRYRGMRDIDQDAEAVHLSNERATPVVDATPVHSRAARNKGSRVTKSVEPGLCRKLHRPEAETVQRPQHIGITFVIEPGFHPQRDGHPPARRDRARIRRG
jgi:hypothetical protein